MGQLPFVRDVHPERMLTRGLMAATAEGLAAQQHARFGDCEGGDGVCVAKRPGRMQTRPTFDLEDNQQDGGGEAEAAGGQLVANDTHPAAGARRRRQLLQGGRTLATILQADTVWAQGFKGQGVKMGVFDTGIKGNHPDVKHIV